MHDSEVVMVRFSVSLQKLQDPRIPTSCLNSADCHWFILSVLITRWCRLQIQMWSICVWDCPLGNVGLARICLSNCESSWKEITVSQEQGLGGALCSCVIIAPGTLRLRKLFGLQLRSGCGRGSWNMFLDSAGFHCASSRAARNPRIHFLTFGDHGLSPDQCDCGCLVRQIHQHKGFVVGAYAMCHLVGARFDERVSQRCLWGLWTTVRDNSTVDLIPIRGIISPIAF